MQLGNYIRIFNPQAESNWSKNVLQAYNSHQEEKKKEYGPRVLKSGEGDNDSSSDEYIRRPKQRVW